MTKKISTIAIPVLCLLLAGCGYDRDSRARQAARDASTEEAAKKAEEAAKEAAKKAEEYKRAAQYTQDEIRKFRMGDSKSKIKEIYGTPASILDGLWIIETKTVDSSGGICRTMEVTFDSDGKVNSVSFRK